MGPHKNPSLEQRLDRLEDDVSIIKSRISRHDNLFKLVRMDINETHQTVKKTYRSLEKWKSDIHNLIDKGFTTPARKLKDEVGILNNQTSNLRQRVEKLESRYNLTTT